MYKRERGSWIQYLENLLRHLAAPFTKFTESEQVQNLSSIFDPIVTFLLASFGIAAVCLNSKTNLLSILPKSGTSRPLNSEKDQGECPSKIGPRRNFQATSAKYFAITPEKLISASVVNSISGSTNHESTFAGGPACKNHNPMWRRWPSCNFVELQVFGRTLYIARFS